MTEDNTVVKPMEHTKKMAEQKWPDGTFNCVVYREGYIQAIKDAFENPAPFGLATLGTYQYEKIHKEVAEGLLEEKDRELARLTLYAQRLKQHLTGGCDCHLCLKRWERYKKEHNLEGI